MPHTIAAADTTMAKLRSLMEAEQGTATASVKEHVEMSSSVDKVHNVTPVNIVDGSVNVSNLTKAGQLTIYLIFNLALTLCNKGAMSKFPCPFLLTAVHAAASVIGTTLALWHGGFQLRLLTAKDSSMLYAFSILYTANIAVSNVSLHMVTIPFHQVIRATSPIFIIAIYRLVYSSTYSQQTYISLLPVILGVGLATYGDYYATPIGFVITLLGAVLAAVKTVVTNRVQTAGLHLSAFELLYRMSPIACFQCLAMAYYGGEWHEAQKLEYDAQTIMMLVCNGALAFGLNIASFNANKKAGALTITVAANIKQILTVLSAVAFWHLKVGILNAIGIALTLVGGAWYAKAEFSQQNTTDQATLANVTDMEEGKAEKS